MLMKNSERWRCTNPACHCEVLVESSGHIEGANPICACGQIMKKKYASPVFTYLDFLRLDESPSLPLGTTRINHAQRTSS